METQYHLRLHYNLLDQLWNFQGSRYLIELYKTSKSRGHRKLVREYRCLMCGGDKMSSHGFFFMVLAFLVKLFSSLFLGEKWSNKYCLEDTNYIYANSNWNFPSYTLNTTKKLTKNTDVVFAVGKLQWHLLMDYFFAMSLGSRYVSREL
jgi:hypothetical protein